MKIYISGPISNMPDLNRPAFTAMKEKLEYLGFLPEKIINPHEIHHNPVTEFNHILGKTPPEPMWSNFMRTDIKAMMDCDAIVMLKGWENSNGAKLEKHIAEALFMPIMKEEELK